MKFVGNSGSVENPNGIFSNSGVLFLRPEESDDDDDEPFVGRAEVAVQESSPIRDHWPNTLNLEPLDHRVIKADGSR